ncbi:MAG: NAD+ synthase [Thermodesulfobacteriota bacterium]
MRITLAQLNPKVGDFENNLAKALETLERTRAEAPDLVVFPELFLMGYPPQDLLEKAWFVRKQDQALTRLAAASVDFPHTGIVLGAALPSHLTPGRGLYNAAVLLHQGRTVFAQAKSLLPTYDVFDEARYFDPAQDWKVCPFKDEVLGLNVCEDAWNDPGFWQNNPLYACNPIRELAQKNPTLFINVSASPFHAGKDVVRHRLIRGHAVSWGRPFLFLNQVGGNDELIFDGRSMFLDGQGRGLVFCPPFAERVVTLDTKRPAVTEFAPQDEVESVLQALVLGLRDYMGKSGFKTAVVGLSGGIDSAVTFALAAQALGPENVLGVSMPSMYSSRGSLDDSRALAENLGARYKVVPIKAIYDSYLAELAEPFQNLPPDVTEENIQARIRGNILMAFSNKFGHLVLSTGNKSELAMGYCTLYGDMSGGLAVLSDVPKTMVYDLAGLVNREREIIPRATIEKAPSAELRPNQTDQDTLPPYDLLDRILQLHVEEGFSSEEIIEKGFDPDTVRWVVRTINRNEYKRKQAPPGLKVTSKAFGMGRRMPLVANHDV